MMMMMMMMVVAFGGFQRGERKTAQTQESSHGFPLGFKNSTQKSIIEKIRRKIETFYLLSVISTPATRVVVVVHNARGIIKKASFFSL